MRQLLPAILALALLLAAGCNELDEWRDGQIAESERIARGSQLALPATPVELPASLRRELPLDSSFTILSHTEAGSVHTVVALSPWKAEQTALWLVARLSELGYDSGDNASRVLEGATYTRERGSIRSLWVKLNLNTSEQVTVEYRSGG